MASGVTLLAMATDLRATLGYSMNLAHGVDQQPALYAALARTQTELWDVYDWPELYSEIDVPVPIAGSGTSPTVTIPTSLDFNHLNDVWWRASGNRDRGCPLTYGIWAEHRSKSDYASFPTDTGTPERWAFKSASAAQPTGQIELWPAPSVAGVCTFGGRIALQPLIVTTDVCTLDSELIIAQAAVPIMLRNKDPTAQLQLKKAQDLFVKIRARQGSNNRKPFLIMSRI